MKCINFSDVIDYYSDNLERQTKENIRLHLESCRDCRNKIESYAKFRTILKKTQTYQPITETEECFNESDIAYYLEGGQKGKVHKNFLEHINHCDLCLDRLISVEKLLSELKTEGLIKEDKTNIEMIKRSIYSIFKSPGINLKLLWDMILKPRPVYRLAIIIFLMFICFILFLPNYIDNESFRTRETEAEALETKLQLLYPANKSEIVKHSLEFKWKEVVNTSNYDFLLLDSNGGIVWEKKTSRARIKLPTNVHLETSQTYFWQIEARLETGGSILSEMYIFNIKPNK